MKEQQVADGMREQMASNQSFMRGFVETCADRGFSKMETLGLWDDAKNPHPAGTRQEYVKRD